MAPKTSTVLGKAASAILNISQILVSMISATEKGPQGLDLDFSFAWFLLVVFGGLRSWNL